MGGSGGRCVQRRRCTVQISVTIQLRDSVNVVAPRLYVWNATGAVWQSAALTCTGTVGVTESFSASTGLLVTAICHLSQVLPELF